MGNFVVTLVVYNSTAIHLIYEMYTYHRLAFWEHVRSLVSLFLATEVTLLSILLTQAILVFRAGCMLTAGHLGNDYGGVCEIQDLEHYYDKFGILNFSGNLVTLLPTIAFLALNKPHDCYVCLGKDPERVYSRFQLNLEERTRRKIQAKLSSDQ